MMTIRNPLPILSRLSAMAALWLAAPGFSEAQEVSADAVILSERLAVGEAGFMILRTVNGAPDSLPGQIRVDGLTITKAHEEFVRSSDNVTGSRSEYHFYYRIVGNREGEFTIPAQSVRVNNQDLTTKPLEITIFARKAGDEMLDAKRPFFSVLTLSKREFYVGQMVPSELKVYVRGLRSIIELGRPKLQHDQVVVQGFTQGEMDAVQLDGIPFSTASLNGSFFALSPGEYAIGPATVDVRMRESSRFGSVGFFQTTQVRPFQSDAVAVVVKPLPETGRPDTFRGAVGQFRMSMTATPKDLKVGDPISLEFEVSGPGNLESVEAPVFLPADPDAWRIYDARKIVDPAEFSDGTSSGRATFSQIVMPRRQVDEIPPFELAFFTPRSGEYGVQRTDPVPIRVAADERPVSPAAAVAPPGGGMHSAAAATPEASYDDILFISLEKPDWKESAVPLAVTSRPTFWLAQAVPSAALFTILGFGFARFARERADRRRQRESELSFENARAAVGTSGDRGGHYHEIQAALTAWQRESETPPDQLPDGARTGFQELQSACQWVLYGARDSEREASLSSEESAKNRQVLESLSRFPG